MDVKTVVMCVELKIDLIICQTVEELDSLVVTHIYWLKRLFDTENGQNKDEY